MTSLIQTSVWFFGIYLTSFILDSSFDIMIQNKSLETLQDLAKSTSILCNNVLEKIMSFGITLFTLLIDFLDKLSSQHNIDVVYNTVKIMFWIIILLYIIMHIGYMFDNFYWRAKQWWDWMFLMEPHVKIDGNKNEIQMIPIVTDVEPHAVPETHPDAHIPKDSVEMLASDIKMEIKKEIQEKPKLTKLLRQLPPPVIVPKKETPTTPTTPTPVMKSFDDTPLPTQQKQETSVTKSFDDTPLPTQQKQETKSAPKVPKKNESKMEFIQFDKKWVYLDESRGVVYEGIPDNSKPNKYRAGEQIGTCANFAITLFDQNKLG